MSNQSGRISQRKTNSAASTLPEIGKLKIGEKATTAGGKEYPKALDYFRPTGNFAGAFTHAHGEKPTAVPICFISDNLSEVCNERYESWTNGKRHGWGDGETFTVWEPTGGADSKGAYVEGVSAADARVRALKWDIMLTLRFVMLKMKGVLGYWTFQTKAKATTIPSIVQAFDFVKGRAGTIIGFPFTLMVERKKGYNPGEAKNYPVVTLVPNFSEQSIAMVNDYLEAGGSVNKLSTAMIEQNKVLQLAPPDPSTIPAAGIQTTDQPALDGGDKTKKP